MSRITRKRGGQERSGNRRLTEDELDLILSKCAEPVPIPGTPHDLIDVLHNGLVLIAYREWDRDRASVEIGFGTVELEHPIAQHPIVQERARAKGWFSCGEN